MQAMASMALWCILIDACSLQLLCYVRCIQSPLNLLEGGFAGRLKICNQLLQGIDEQGTKPGLAAQAAQKEGEPSAPPPTYLETQASKSDRHQYFIQNPRVGCVFTQQSESAFDRLLIRPSKPQRQPENGDGLLLFNPVKHNGSSVLCGSYVVCSFRYKTSYIFEIHEQLIKETFEIFSI